MGRCRKLIADSIKSPFLCHLWSPPRGRISCWICMHSSSTGRVSLLSTADKRISPALFFRNISNSEADLLWSRSIDPRTIIVAVPARHSFAIMPKLMSSMARYIFVLHSGRMPCINCVISSIICDNRNFRCIFLPIISSNCALPTDRLDALWLAVSSLDQIADEISVGCIVHISTRPWLTSFRIVSRAELRRFL